jgi:hypothetical protein
MFWRGRRSMDRFPDIRCFSVRQIIRLNRELYMENKRFRKIHSMLPKNTQDHERHYREKTNDMVIKLSKAQNELYRLKNAE